MHFTAVRIGIVLYSSLRPMRYTHCYLPPVTHKCVRRKGHSVCFPQRIVLAGQQEQTVVAAVTRTALQVGWFLYFCKRSSLCTLSPTHTHVHTNRPRHASDWVLNGTNVLELRVRVYSSDSVFRNLTTVTTETPRAFAVLRRDVGYAKQSVARSILYVDY